MSDFSVTHMLFKTSNRTSSRLKKQIFHDYLMSNHKNFYNVKLQITEAVWTNKTIVCLREGLSLYDEYSSVRGTSYETLL